MLQLRLGPSNLPFFISRMIFGRGWKASKPTFLDPAPLKALLNITAWLMIYNFVNRRNEEFMYGLVEHMRFLTISVWFMVSMLRTRLHYDTACSRRANFGQAVKGIFFERF